MGILCQEWREKTREAQSELEPLRKRLREKEVYLEASARTLESQKAQTQRWEKRVTQVWRADLDVCVSHVFLIDVL